MKFQIFEVLSELHKKQYPNYKYKPTKKVKKQAENSRTNNTPIGASDEEHSYSSVSSTYSFGAASGQQVQIPSPYTTTSTGVKGTNNGTTTRKRGSGASNYGNGGDVRAKRYTN